MDKPAQNDYPIEPLLARRWSPRAFADRPLSGAELASLLEAARWAPSCFNDQPWSFIVAPRADAEAFERLSSCLVEANRVWAARAPVLLLSVARLAFARNDKPNRHAVHDVGLAVQSMALQATAMGLALHQMAGFDVERARTLLGLPEGHEPVAMIALGAPGDPETLPDDLRERERAPRTRKPLAELAFAGSFGQPLELPPPASTPSLSR
jgi:nitroreductase